MILGHIQPLIHSLCTFIHQTYTLYMSYTRYWAIFNHWYIAYTLLNIRHTPCTCRMHGIGPYNNVDTWPVHFYTSDIHPIHVVYTVLGHIQPLIHSLCTLYIRHSPCTCRIHDIGPYNNVDTWPVHFYTSDIHSVHIVYTVLGHIQPLIHSLYTFIHQTYTMHISYTRYWAIFKNWYIAYTLLYIRHTPCTCRIHGIGEYSRIDT